MARLFTGIEIPDHIRDALAVLRQPLPGARWIDPAHFHITLRFAGDVDGRTARDLADLLAEVRGRAFELRLQGLGTFGGAEPRSIWAGVAPSDDLARLARAHERAARAAGLQPEGRTFRPHVTLARLSSSREEAVARFLGRNGAFRTEPFFVSRFVLFSSRPFVGGGPYGVEEAFMLDGGIDEESLAGA
jgi:2'-5' RNA ligase